MQLCFRTTIILQIKKVLKTMSWLNAWQHVMPYTGRKKILCWNRFWLHFQEEIFPSKGIYKGLHPFVKCNCRICRTFSCLSLLQNTSPQNRYQCLGMFISMNACNGIVKQFNLILNAETATCPPNGWFV